MGCIQINLVRIFGNDPVAIIHPIQITGLGWDGPKKVDLPRKNDEQ
jgi:hypothetical protein